MDEVLAKAGLFQGVPAEDAEVIAGQFDMIDVPRGTVVFHEGVPGHHLQYGAARVAGDKLSRFSRSQGMVFSGSHLQSPGAGRLYQIWLLTATDPVSAGTITPDDSGRVTFASDHPPDVPRAIVGVRVTVEPAPGRPTPSAGPARPASPSPAG